MSDLESELKKARAEVVHLRTLLAQACVMIIGYGGRKAQNEVDRINKESWALENQPK